MNNEEIQSKLEEAGLSTSLIDEILINIKKDDGIVSPLGLSLDDRIFLLKSILEKETDPRRKASIAARIISEKL